MATKSAQAEPEKAEVIEELLDTLDTTLDRVKVLYEQYFLGIQKQAPSVLHNDVERKLRDLTQMQIRNTGLRYRFATLQQKFGSYNSYWRRTLKQIENGTYARNLSKIGRQAAKTGQEIPEEILAAMPKRMREQVKRDRDAALAIQKRRAHAEQPVAPSDDELLTLADDDEDDGGAAFIREPTGVRKNALTAGGAHRISEDDDLDMDAFFKEIEGDEASPIVAKSGPSGRAGRTTIAPAPGPGRPPAPVQNAAPPRVPRAATVVTADDPRGETTAIPRMRTGGEDEITEPVSMPQGRAQPAGSAPAGHTTALPRMPRAATSPGDDNRQTTALPRMPTTGVPAGPPRAATSGGAPAGQTTAIPRMPTAAPVTSPGQTTAIPRIPTPGQTTAIPRIPAASGAIPPIPSPARPIPASQQTRPNPIMPGSSTARPAVPVESMSGPFPRMPQSDATTEPPASPPPRPAPRPAAPPVGATRPALPVSKPPAEAPMRPPPGMSDADVNALYAKYVQAKEAVGDNAGPGAYGKLLKTINAQAPRIMEQYKAKGVEFSVVVKDNQVIIKAKPKT